MNPQVTVIIPAYNCASTIGRTIESIRSQSLSDWELIVVDDCSTDSTAAVVAALAESDSRIRIVSLPANTGGAFSPRRHAIALAHASRIAPVDADDTVNPDYLASLLSHGSQIVYATLCFVSTDGERLQLTAMEPDTEYHGPELIIHTLGGWHLSGLGLFDKSLMDAAYSEFDRLGFDASHPFADELLTRLILHSAKTVTFEPKARYNYIQHSGSVTHVSGETSIKRLTLGADILNWVARHYSPESPEYRAAHAHNFHLTIEGMRMLRNLLPASPATRAIIARSYSLIDWPTVKPAVSARLYRGLRLGLKPASLLFSLQQFLKSRLSAASR